LVNSIQGERIDVLFVILDVNLTIENSAVFQAQVLDQVIALKKIGYSIALMCAGKSPKKFDIVAGERLARYGIPSFMIKDQGLLKNIVFFTRELIRIKKSFGVGRVYVRGFWAAYPVLLSSITVPLGYVYDVRGDIVDESLGRGRRQYRRSLIGFLEGFALRRALYVTCVTSSLAVLVKRRARLKSVPDVIPSCIDLDEFSHSEEKRRLRRRELGYSDDDVVFVYSGGIAHYQMIPEMIALWRLMMLIDVPIKFLLMINSDPPTSSRVLGDLSDFGNRLQILKLPRTEVFDTLSAADIGFLLRENRVLNSAASPVKFAEYLSAGLAVVSSPGLGDISGRIAADKLGVLVDPCHVTAETGAVSDFVRSFKSDRWSYRERALRFAREVYSWGSYKETYRALYGRPGGI